MGGARHPGSCPPSPPPPRAPPQPPPHPEPPTQLLPPEPHALLELLLRLGLQRLVLLGFLLHPSYVILHTLLQRLFVLGGRWTLSPERRPSSLGGSWSSRGQGHVGAACLFPCRQPRPPRPPPGTLSAPRGPTMGFRPGTVGETGSGTRPTEQPVLFPQPRALGAGCPVAPAVGVGNSAAASTDPQSLHRPT